MMTGPLPPVSLSSASIFISFPSISKEDGPGDYHTKWSKSDRIRQIYDIVYMWNLKTMTWINLFTKTDRNRLTDLENRDGMGIEIDQEFGMYIYTLLYLKKIIIKDLLYSTGNTALYSVITKWEKNLKKKSYICLYNWISLLYTWN